MIVQIAGTSGSGKSHLMRAFLDWARKRGEVKPQREKGRPAPLLYSIVCKDLQDPVVVLGAYETPTGGCDTIKPLEKVFQQVQFHQRLGRHVLYEGLFCMNQTRGPLLAEEFGEQMVVLQLTTSLEECIASINSRRAERGAGKLEKLDNTRGNFRRAQRYCDTMHDVGARVIKVNRQQALPQLLHLIGAS